MPQDSKDSIEHWQINAWIDDSRFDTGHCVSELALPGECKEYLCFQQLHVRTSVRDSGKPELLLLCVRVLVVGCMCASHLPEVDRHMARHFCSQR